MTSKKQLTAKIEEKIQEAKNVMSKFKYTEVKPVVTVAKISPRKYHVGFRFETLDKQVGDESKANHPQDFIEIPKIVWTTS